MERSGAVAVQARRHIVFNEVVGHMRLMDTLLGLTCCVCIWAPALSNKLLFFNEPLSNLLSENSPSHQDAPLLSGNDFKGAANLGGGYNAYATNAAAVMSSQFFTAAEMPPTPIRLDRSSVKLRGHFSPASGGANRVSESNGNIDSNSKYGRHENLDDGRLALAQQFSQSGLDSQKSEEIRSKEIEAKCKACDDCKKGAQEDEELTESKCMNECSVISTGVSDEDIQSKVTEAVKPQGNNDDDCPKFELSTICLHKYLPNQIILGVSAGFNRLGGGVDMVIDYDTHEIGFFWYGRCTIIGSNMLAETPDASFYVGLGWKGVDKGEKLKDQYSGFGATADLAIGKGFALASAELQIAVGVAAGKKEVDEATTCSQQGTPPTVFGIRWDAGKTIAIGAGVSVGPSLPVKIGGNIGIARQHHIYSVSPLICKSKAPYCMAAMLFVTPGVVPIFSKVIVMQKFMETWCPTSDAEGSFLCDSSEKLPDPKEDGDGKIIKSGGRKAWTWQAVLSVWAEKGAHLMNLLKKSFVAGKLKLEALTSEMAKAKERIAEAIKEFVGEFIDDVREYFGQVDPDTLAVERIGLPKGQEEDGGVYLKIKDCDGDNFEDDSSFFPVKEFDRPYWECTPVGEKCGHDGDECRSFDTSAAFRGGRKPDDPPPSFVVAPDTHRFYWDYSTKEEDSGWGRIWRGEGMDKCVMCMLRERRVGIDAYFDDTTFKVCAGKGGALPAYQSVRVRGDVVKKTTHCNVMWKWCPGNGGKCLV